MARASGRGWLGWLRARYEIAPERVTVTRSWLPALLIAGLPGGTWLIVKGLDHPVPYPDVTPPMIAGFIVVCHVLGILGLLFTPWFGPRRIVCTPDGVTVGSQRVEAADVRSIGIEVSVQRGKGPATYTVFIAVQSQFVIDSLRMPILWSSHPRPAPVIEVIDAMRGVLRASSGAPVDDGILVLPP